MPTFEAARLLTFATELLATRATAEESQRVAVGLVNANLRGYESHGVMRLPYYLQAVADALGTQRVIGVGLVEQSSCRLFPIGAAQLAAQHVDIGTLVDNDAIPQCPRALVARARLPALARSSPRKTPRRSSLMSSSTSSLVNVRPSNPIERS